MKRQGACGTGVLGKAGALLVAVGMLSGAGLGACSAASEGGSGNPTGSTGGAGGVGGAGVGGDTSVGGGLTVGVGGGPPSVCTVSESDESGVVPTCEDKAPADAFAPEVQWTWTVPAAPSGNMTGSYATPLVGNFTDDNSDGAIDLCDIPDVVVTTLYNLDGGLGLATGNMHLLSGDTGQLHFTYPGEVDAFVSPSFGDIDGDGLPEVVTADTAGHLVAYEHDGTLKWTGDLGGYRTTLSSAYCAATAIYDLDADGTPEILFGWEVFDNQGHKRFGDPTNASEHGGTYWCVTPTAADLDDDGKLEVVLGHEVFRSDGSLFWKLQGFTPGQPQVANLDADPEPEILLTTQNGISVIEHDGAVKFGPVRPTGSAASPNCWSKPSVVHDFDGDGVADVAMGSCDDYTVYSVGPAGLTPRWSQSVQDMSGLATATAFDFLGDGVAEAIYGDESQIYVFDGQTGSVQLTSPRQSGTLIEYPVVADVDNDGSAEIIYVSNYPAGTDGPTVTVLRDAEERWIPARRIWNQHSYHVTNVREDGTIPQHMKKSWELLNTFRTNAQISAQGECVPAPPQ
ncbi:FG-GAP repeat domain-containing protein [Chondromyces apiculatus]|uniref:Hemolysin-related protein Vcp n=1 Tax=Chondromyces apiculatus DSM 436 TaxID=1192034 RepID=A0A017TAG8_9BACT|nr:VCBS repeat-containing protein [Chondromyces apiculatus]EYF06229.1 Hemolysin-related protein Vcp [Chondromyces apiculatus DSM 436]